MIGDPIDIHCSLNLRQALMMCWRQRGDCVKQEEGVVNGHFLHLSRLEASHLYNMLLSQDEDAKSWPWESNLDVEPVSCAAASADNTVCNDGCLIKREEDMFGGE